MITYTGIMGVGTGIGLILVFALGYRLLWQRQSVPVTEGWALAFGCLGAILTGTGFHMTVHWPLKPPEEFKNFMFGEPALAFGVLMLAIGIFLWRRGESLGEDAVVAAGRPLSVIAGGMGLVLLACAVGAFRYRVFATAPPQEPILGSWPKELINASLSLLFALPAIGALLSPVALYSMGLGVCRRATPVRRAVLAVIGIACLLAGVGWLVVGALSYYTHIAMAFGLRGIE